MIARTWRGVTPEAKADKYLDYLRQTGVEEYQATEGNQGVVVLRRLHEGKAEFLLISLWNSVEDIRRFAGDEIDKAVYYPEDQEFLIAFEPHVEHYEVLLNSDAKQH